MCNGQLPPRRYSVHVRAVCVSSAAHIIIHHGTWHVIIKRKLPYLYALKVISINGEDCAMIEAPLLRGGATLGFPASRSKNMGCIKMTGEVVI